MKTEVVTEEAERPRYTMHPAEIVGLVLALSSVPLVMLVPESLVLFTPAVTVIGGGFLLIGQQRRLSAWRRYWDAHR